MAAERKRQITRRKRSGKEEGKKGGWQIREWERRTKYSTGGKK